MKQFYLDVDNINNSSHLFRNVIKIIIIEIQVAITLRLQF